MHLLAFPVGAAVAALLYLERTRALYPLIVIFTALVVQTRFSTGRTQNYLLSLTTIMAAAVGIEILGMVLEPKIHESVEDGLWEPRLVVGWGPQRPGPFRATRSFNGRKAGARPYSWISIASSCKTQLDASALVSPA